MASPAKRLTVAAAVIAAVVLVGAEAVSSQSPPENVPAEVYWAIIREAFKGTEPTGLLIRNHTMRFPVHPPIEWRTPEWRLQFEFIPEALRTSIAGDHAAPEEPLTPALFPPPARLVGAADLATAPREPWWETISARFGGLTAFLTFSRVLTTPDGAHALVYYWLTSAPPSPIRGHEGYAWLRHDARGWRVARVVIVHNDWIFVPAAQVLTNDDVAVIDACLDAYKAYDIAGHIQVLHSYRSIGVGGEMVDVTAVDMPPRIAEKLQRSLKRNPGREVSGKLIMVSPIRWTGGQASVTVNLGGDAHGGQGCRARKGLFGKWKTTLQVQD